MSSVASPAAVAGRPLQLCLGASAAARTAGGPARSRSASRCSGSPHQPTPDAPPSRQRHCAGAVPLDPVPRRPAPWALGRHHVATLRPLMRRQGSGPVAQTTRSAAPIPNAGIPPGRRHPPTSDTSHPLMAAGVRDGPLALSAQSPHGNRRPSDHRWSSVPRHTARPTAGRATTAGGRRSAPWWCGRLACARGWGLVGGGGLVFVVLVQLVGLPLAVDTGRG